MRKRSLLWSAATRSLRLRASSRRCSSSSDQLALASARRSCAAVSISAFSFASLRSLSAAQVALACARLPRPGCRSARWCRLYAGRFPTASSIATRPAARDAGPPPWLFNSAMRRSAASREACAPESANAAFAVGLLGRPRLFDHAFGAGPPVAFAGREALCHLDRGRCLGFRDLLRDLGVPAVFQLADQFVDLGPPALLLRGQALLFGLLSAPRSRCGGARSRRCATWSRRAPDSSSVSARQADSWVAMRSRASASQLARAASRRRSASALKVSSRRSDTHSFFAAPALVLLGQPRSASAASHSLRALAKASSRAGPERASVLRFCSRIHLDLEDLQDRAHTHARRRPNR